MKEAKNMKEAKTKEAIERHCRGLLAIFPNASETDPTKLYKELKRLEDRAHKLAEDYCNGHVDSDGWEAKRDKIRDKLNTLLNPGDVPVFLNGDPRGYALKIEDEWMREALSSGKKLQTDWGGYGLLAPDLTE